MLIDAFRKGLLVVSLVFCSPVAAQDPDAGAEPPRDVIDVLKDIIRDQVRDPNKPAQPPSPAPGGIRQ